MGRRRRKAASLAPTPTSCLLIGPFVLVTPRQYSIRWKLKSIQCQMTIFLSEERSLPTYPGMSSIWTMGELFLMVE